MTERRVPKNKGFRIEPFMVNELGLTSDELLVYGIIYDACKSGDGAFRQPASYLARWIGMSRTTVMHILKSLTTRGVITKHDVVIDRVKHCDYMVNRNVLSQKRSV